MEDFIDNRDSGTDDGAFSRATDLGEFVPGGLDKNQSGLQSFEDFTDTRGDGMSSSGSEDAMFTGEPDLGEFVPGLSQDAEEFTDTQGDGLSSFGSDDGAVFSRGTELGEFVPGGLDDDQMGLSQFEK